MNPIFLGFGSGFSFFFFRFSIILKWNPIFSKFSRFFVLLPKCCRVVDPVFTKVQIRIRYFFSDFRYTGAVSHFFCRFFKVPRPPTHVAGFWIRNILSFGSGSDFIGFGSLFSNFRLYCCGITPWPSF